MTKNITVAKSWRQLNQWQIQEIAHLYLNNKAAEFEKAYEKMIFILFQKEHSHKGRKFLYEITSEIPISELEFHARFLVNTTDFHTFPDIPGLIKPFDRLGDISARHFSTIDTYFFSWNKDRSLINLKRLVATLYRLKPEFDELDLVAVSKLTDQIPEKQMSAIALAYLFSRKLLEESFPIVFPPKKKETEEERLTPKFHKKEADFVPFDKAIIGMAMDENQPLGKKQDVNNVRIYEFLSVMSESIIINQQKEKPNAGK